MNKTAAHLCLARTDSLLNANNDTTLKSMNGNVVSVFQLPPDQAAEYIAEILISLRAIAVKAQLNILADLIEVAHEEAKLNTHP